MACGKVYSQCKAPENIAKSLEKLFTSVRKSFQLFSKIGERKRELYFVFDEMGLWYIKEKFEIQMFFLVNKNIDFTSKLLFFVNIGEI